MVTFGLQNWLKSRKLGSGKSGEKKVGKKRRENGPRGAKRGPTVIDPVANVVIFELVWPQRI